MAVIHAPKFQTRIEEIGVTDEERAVVLGVTRKTAGNYRTGRIGRTLLALMRDPAALRALAEDAEDLNQRGANA